MNPTLRFRTARLVALSILLSALLVGCATAPPRPQSIARGDYDGIQTYVRQFIQHEMKANSVTGLSIALVDDQHVVWAEGFGFTDKEHGVPASPQTIYRVGSISKLFTATAAMQLAEQKKLDIDRPLQDYLPEFSIQSRYAPSAAITPRMLMTHHSGLPRDFAKGMFTRDPEPFTHLVEQIKREDAAYPPNQVFSYSNVGVTLLGHAIQNVSGRPFADYLQQSVLGPLGMTTATFEPGPSRSELMSKAYRKGELAEELPLREVPAGGLNASVVDISRFLSMIFANGKSGERQILTAESVAEMLRPQNTAVPLDLNFYNGLGWMLSTLGNSTIEDAGPVAHHAGGMIYFRTQLYALPEHKLGVIVMANSGTAGRVVDRVATETLSLALEAKSGIRQPQHPKVPAADPPWPAERLESYVGDYTSIVGHARIRLEGKRLVADAMGHSFNLVPRSDGQLGVEYSLLGLLHIDLGTLGEIGFSRRALAGRDVLVARLGKQEMLIGERIQPPANLGRWRQRLGNSEITNAGNDHTFVDRIALVEERGFLFAELAMTDGPVSRIPLRIISDNEALMLGPLADGGGTMRCTTKVSGVEQCSISGYVLKRVAN